MSQLHDELIKLGLQVSDEQLDQIAQFEDALYTSNQVKNLTRIPREEAWIRHIIDSVLFHDLFPENGLVLDIGTGPGFPAWPLALLRPDLRITAIDSNGKMLDFLRANLLPNITVLEIRIEEWDQLGKFDAVTGRAVAPLSIQLEISVPFAKLGGYVLPMRTQNDLEEIDRCNPFLGAEILSVEERILPIAEATRVVPVYQKRERSPEGYPRRWSDIKRRPL